MPASTCPPHACELCQLIQFDDSQHGGFASDFTGKTVLDFPDPLPRQKPFYSTNDDYLRTPTTHLRIPCDAWSDSLPDLPELKELEEKGCKFARLLRDAILNSEIEFEGRVHLDLEYDWRNGGQNNDWGLNALSAMIGLVMSDEEAERSREDFDVVRKYGEDGAVAKWNYYVQFGIESGDGNCAQWLDLEPSPAIDVLCEENASLLRSEVDRCINNCHPPRPSHFVPTRLLDLGTTEEGDVRLIETTDYEVAPEYVALSYCWGPPEEARTQLKTERATMINRKNGIPSQIMSHVMQDAVKTTRILSYRYLWIDALCIVQDDKQDWERESAMMGQVYSNAVLTLCSLSSSSCHQGFLQRTETSLSVSFQSKIDPKISGSYRLRPYPVEKDRSRGYLQSSDEINGAQSSWRTRAWTFQEYELSTRIVYFGKSRIHFACPERTWIEGNHSRENPKFLQAFVHHIHDYDAGTIDKDTLYTHWLRLLERFGDRQCTFASDKLPAISGLAKLMAGSISDTYIAGMWNGALAPGLLWSTTESPECFGLGQHLEACATTSIPSWTWVNQMQRFKHGHSLFWLDSDEDLKSECSTLSAKSCVNEFTLNPFGTASNAILSLTGKTYGLKTTLQRIHVSQDRQIWKTTLNASTTAWIELDYTVHHALKTLPVDVKMVLIASATGLTATNQGLEQSAAQMAGKEDWMSVSDDSEESDSDESDLDSENERRHGWGVLLHPMEKDGEYYRVGIFTTRAEKVGGLVFFESCEGESVVVK